MNTKFKCSRCDDPVLKKYAWRIGPYETDDGIDHVYCYPCYIQQMRYEIDEILYRHSVAARTGTSDEEVEE